jgi:hypothetical protein
VHAVPYGARLSFLMISMTLSMDCFGRLHDVQNEKNVTARPSIYIVCSGCRNHSIWSSNRCIVRSPDILCSPVAVRWQTAPRGSFDPQRLSGALANPTLN